MAKPGIWLKEGVELVARPDYLPVHVGGIPADLLALDRWVCWRAEWRANATGGRWTKVPYRVDGRVASSTNSSTWSGFDATLAAYQSGCFTGLGWVFQPPYCGIDCDECVTGDQLQADVAAWIPRFASFTERSVSNSGLHIICRADLAPFGRKVGPREAYNFARFFTISGHRWGGTPPTVEERPTIVSAFLRDLGGTDTTAPVVPVQPRMPTGRYAHLGHRARAWLVSTGPAGGKPSASEADAAAAAALIATGHTAEEALALLLDSPRGHAALQRKGTHGLAYLQRTIANAAAHVGPVVQRATGLRSHRVVVRRPTTVPFRTRRPA